MTDRTEAVERAVRACYRTWSTTYFEDYYSDKAAYPPVHARIVRDQLAAAGARSVLDAGCGPASMLRLLAMEGLDRYGFDLTPEMVEEARRVLAPDVPGDRLWQGSVLDAAAFRPPSGRPELFDAVVCIGVLPHVPAEQDAAVLENLTRAVVPGGLVMVEGRNELFGLFTLNRYSRGLFRDSLIGEDALAGLARPEERDGLAAAMAELDERFRLDLPPVRRGEGDDPGYDEVLSRTHNPFVLRGQAEAAGLSDVEVLFYHYHAVPPMLERHVPDLARRASLAMEDPRDWRGHVMASAFILAGRRAR